MQVWTKIGRLNDEICLQPTVLAFHDFVRIYAGYLIFPEIVGFAGFLDVSLPDCKILWSKRRVLVPGKPGTFDSFGTIPTWVWRRGGSVLMYYAGYQQLKDVRFCAFGGMAQSTDGGESFDKVIEVPVMDRTPNEPLFRVPHCVIKEDERLHVWYGGGGKFISGAHKTLPTYDIRYTSTRMPWRFDEVYHDALTYNPDLGEHRVGRPCVIHEGVYKMWYCYGTETTFNIGFATSKSHSNFTRQDQLLEFHDDANLRAYPAVFDFHGHRYMAYNTAYGVGLLENPGIVIAMLEEKE